MLDNIEIEKKTTIIVDVFTEKIYPELTINSKVIYENLKTSLENLCREKEIFSSNSVYSELLPFSIIHRVKQPDSLKEKLVRKVLYDTIYDEDFEKIEQNIKKHLDDLIGITILVDTSRYLDSFANMFINEEVSNFKLLGTNDNKYRKIGELKYFNIKTNYSSNNINSKVEIQIKSAIVAPFVNLQHKLIYKNNRVMISKKNSDFMINAVTPAINAIEKVLDIVENSSKMADEELIEFVIKRKVEELIHSRFNNTNLFDCHIDSVGNILVKMYSGFKELNTENSLEKFWEKYEGKTEENFLLELDSDIIKVILSIINIEEKIIEYVFVSEYLYLSPDGEKQASKATAIYLSYKDFRYNKLLNTKLLLDEKFIITKYLIDSKEMSDELIDELTDVLVESDIIHNDTDLENLKNYFSKMYISKLLKLEHSYLVDDLVREFRLDEYTKNLSMNLFNEKYDVYVREKERSQL